jgi:hypothetical protein
MEFNIHQHVFDDNGEYLEKEGQRYLNQLVALFEDSSEAQELYNQDIEPRWIGMLLDYAASYLGVTPLQMTAQNLQELLFDLVPRKISAPAEDAPEIIREMRLFWTFLGREFQLGNATECLRVLNEKAVRRLHKEMSNPANFGFAKAYVMQGMERGFDMSRQEDIDEWMLTYNQEIAHKNGSPFALPALSTRREEPFALIEHKGIGSHRASAEKTRRKMAKHSRKQNRKR